MKDSRRLTVPLYAHTATPPIILVQLHTVSIPDLVFMAYMRVRFNTRPRTYTNSDAPRLNPPFKSCGNSSE